MGRSASRRREPVLPKVEKIRLNEEHMGLRFLAFVICLALGLCALGFGIYSLLGTEPGWVKIEASSTEARCAVDFSFSYYLQKDATAERKALTTIYTQECIRLSKVFDTEESYEDCPGNLHDINAHPGEEIEADPLLYETLERLLDRGDVSVYQGLQNAYSLNLYYGGEDPFEDPAELRELALDREAIRLELLGENTLRLIVSPECRELAEDLGLQCYLDLGWLRNAAILDALAGELGSRGYTQGIMTSRDGFTRSLGGDIGPVGLSLYKWEGGIAVETGRQELETPANAAALTCFPLPGDDGRAYISQHILMDQRPDGGARELTETLLLHSKEESCLELALRAKEKLLGE